MKWSYVRTNLHAIVKSAEIVYKGIVGSIPSTVLFGIFGAKIVWSGQRSVKMHFYRSGITDGYMYDWAPSFDVSKAN